MPKPRVRKSVDNERASTATPPCAHSTRDTVPVGPHHKWCCACGALYFSYGAKWLLPSPEHLKLALARGAA